MNADNMVGRTVAGYHLAEYIGEGGTATVYRAENAERGRAAVKILRPRLAQDPIAVKRFLREARPQDLHGGSAALGVFRPVHGRGATLADVLGEVIARHGASYHVVCAHGSAKLP